LLLNRGSTNGPQAILKKRCGMKISDFKLERFFARHEFSAPHLLCCSDCETISAGELLSLGDHETEFAELRLGYGESLGRPELREEIAGLYDSITADDILVLSGAEEGIFLLMNTLLEPGDHAVVQFPAYQSLFELARAIGCDVSLWELREDWGWEPDLDALESALRPNTRLIVINFPHNPTGALISSGEFQRVAELAANRGIHVLSDEVYRFSEYSAENRLDGICDVCERGISLGVMSKSFGLAGLRIGWLASRDRGILDRVARMKDYTTICNSGPSELLATIALLHGEKILSRNLDIIRSNLERLDHFFTEHEDIFSWVRPKAGPVALPRLKAGLSAERFCSELIREAGVLLMPSTMFDYGDSHFRIGFGRADMPEALQKLEAYLAAR